MRAMLDRAWANRRDVRLQIVVLLLDLLLLFVALRMAGVPEALAYLPLVAVWLLLNGIQWWSARRVDALLGDLERDIRKAGRMQRWYVRRLAVLTEKEAEVNAAIAALAAGRGSVSRFDLGGPKGKVQ